MSDFVKVYFLFGQDFHLLFQIQFCHHHALHTDKAFFHRRCIHIYLVQLSLGGTVYFFAEKDMVELSLDFKESYEEWQTDEHKSLVLQLTRQLKNGTKCK